FSSRGRHTRFSRDWSSDVCSSDLRLAAAPSVLVLASIGLMVDTVAAMGEEIGWRGLLLPELGRRMSWPAAALVTGAIWAVWHYRSEERRGGTESGSACVRQP